MRQYLQKNLFFGSFLTLLFYSCSPKAGYKLQDTVRVSKHEINPIIHETAALLFKTKIDLYSKHFSGLILIKQTDSLTAHLTFITELGMKMFDFEIKEHKLKLLYIFEPLNKPKLIRLLQSDFELLLLQKAYNNEAGVYLGDEGICYFVNQENNYYYFTDALHYIEKSLMKGGLFNKIKVDYGYTNTHQLEQIYLKHKGLFPLKIKLIAIPNETP